MSIDVRPSYSQAGDRDATVGDILRAVDRLAALTAGWYPNEYHYIGEELFAILLELQSAARKLPPDR